MSSLPGTSKSLHSFYRKPALSLTSCAKTAAHRDVEPGTADGQTSSSHLRRQIRHGQGSREGKKKHSQRACIDQLTPLHLLSLSDTSLGATGYCCVGAEKAAPATSVPTLLLALPCTPLRLCWTTESTNIHDNVICTVSVETVAPSALWIHIPRSQVGNVGDDEPRSRRRSRSRPM